MKFSLYSTDNSQIEIKHMMIIRRISDWSQKNLAFADDTLNEIVRIQIIGGKKLN
jgi:hypothetical protein